MLGTALGSRLPEASGQFKETDVQESTQLASSKINRPGLGGSNKDCRDKALEGEILVGTAGGHSCSCPPNSHTPQNGHHEMSTNSKCWRRFGERESSYAVGGNVNWYSHFGEQCGGFLRN